MNLQRTSTISIGGTVFAVLASCVSTGVVAIFIDKELAEAWVRANEVSWKKEHPGQLWCEEVKVQP